jgi:hypothetical protein
VAKVLVTYPDPERLVRDYLDSVIADATVGIGVPSTWTKASGNHLQVATDGMFMDSYPVGGEATMRLTAWSASPTQAKELVQRAQGYLLAHPGTGGIVSTRPLVGLLPARDEQTNAELATVTVRVTVRSVLIT